MNAAEVIAALDIPANARVDQRVAKKLIVDNGAPTAADRRRINDGIEETHWLAALKPSTIGVPAFRDTAREYLEIAVMSTVFRSGRRNSRLAELIHRAVPYPVFLIAFDNDGVVISLAHKRWSLGESGHTVIDGLLITAGLELGMDPRFAEAFTETLPLTRQPRDNLYTLYQGWIDALAALLAARVTGVFTRSRSPEEAEVRRNALAECVRLDARIASLRAAAAKEKQLSRQVAMNMELQRIQAEYSAARAKL